MPFPPRFELDEREIFELLKGERFYEDVDAAIREAVLNAIDACGRRREIEPDYEREIRVIFDERENRIEVWDNGDGMNKDDVGELFAQIGASASAHLTPDEGGDYPSVGEFGIGVVSYLYAADRFQIHTQKAGNDAFGLEFSDEMSDMETPAKEIPSRRQEVGTTLILFIPDKRRFHKLLGKFDHWVRDVPYLSAKKLPSEEAIKQGGRRAQIKPINLDDDDIPDTIEDAQLGPPDEANFWKTLDGSAKIDVLYRGVFVQPQTISGLWGIKGSLHVNPRKFKPNINRESFIKDGFEEEVKKFLRTIHPKVLETGLENLKTVIEEGELDDWGLRKWATMWLAVPRNGHYSEVAKHWDREFLNIKAFKLLTSEGIKDISVAELKNLEADEIYIAPPKLSNAGVLAKKATRVLRAQGKTVIQGLPRDNTYLKGTNFLGNTSADLLLNHLKDELPDIKKVKDEAKNLLNEAARIVELFPAQPKVALYYLGEDAAPLVKVGPELWLNVESENGRKIALETCDRNDGYLGLLAACQTYAQNHTNQLINLLRNLEDPMQRIGSVRRQYIRRKLE